VIPSCQMLVAACAWLLFGALVSWRREWVGAWEWSGMVAAGLLALDAAWALWQRVPGFSRRLPGRFAVGEPAPVALRIENRSGAMGEFEVFDGLPETAEAEELPLRVRIPARRSGDFRYQATQLVRGEVCFGPAHVRRKSPFGFWWRWWKLGTAESVRVYPDFAPVVRLAMAAMENLSEPSGILQRHRAGVSREFHQLREFHEGDSLAQIDWKATSRHRELISREFEEQRNQAVVFLLDTGRRMRAIDGRLPQFDHCLNAALVLAWVALRQGDQVGVQGFGGSDRWLPPQRGGHAIAAVLNHLYDYQTTAAPSDFAEAAERLMQRQRRRAMVVMLTNLRGEDDAELRPALRMLRGRHLVVLGSLREQSIETLRRTPVERFGEALRFGAAEAYIAERWQLLRGLEGEGVVTVDVPAGEFPVALAKRYLEIKRTARL